MDEYDGMALEDNEDGTKRRDVVTAAALPIDYSKRDHLGEEEDSEESFCEDEAEAAEEEDDENGEKTDEEKLGINFEEDEIDAQYDFHYKEETQ